MLTHNWSHYSNFSENMRAKSDYQSLIRTQAKTLTNASVEIIYGSYLDVIPIAYGSSYKLRPISVRYNRFPLTDFETSQTFIVAVNAAPVEQWGEEGLTIAESVCTAIDEIQTVSTKFKIYKCLGSDISGSN